MVRSADGPQILTKIIFKVEKCLSKPRCGWITLWYKLKTKHMKTPSAFIIFFGLFAAVFLPRIAFGQNEIYIAPGANGAGTAGDPIGLQGGLDLAVSNGAQDILYLATGNYLDAPYVMEVNTGDGQDIVISGGWNADFSDQTENPELTSIDGQGSQRCFEINAEGIPANTTISINYLTFANGHIDGNGAGVYVNSASPVTANTHVVFNRCDFINNSTEGSFQGGGVYTKTSFELLQCLFDNNVASNGGAVFATYGDASPDALRSIDECTFIGNQNYGNQGSTIYTACPNMEITRSDFHGMPDGSSNGTGSCVYVATGGFATIDRCEFSNLRIDYWGSAVQSWDSGFKISNSLFLNNLCGELSGYGAVTFYHNNGPDRYHEVTNCTFVANTSGNGFYADLHYRGNGNDELHVYNCIFWGNAQSSVYKESGTADIANSISMSPPLNFTELTPTSGADPMFNGEYGIEAGSPAQDAGNNDYVDLASFDLFGSPRVLGGTVDIGCDEYNAPPAGIELSVQMIDENAPQDVDFSVASATGQVGDTHTFELAEGDGTNDADNVYFYFTSNQLHINTSPNHELQDSYAIYVRAIDADDQTVEQAFTIAVNDLNEAPMFVENVPDQSGVVGVPNSFEIDPAAVEDEDADDVLTFTAALSDGNELPDWLTFDGETLTFSGTPEAATTYEIKLTVTDAGGLSDFVFFFYTIGGVGLADHDALSLDVFPNPATDRIRFETECSGNTEYWISDIQGKILANGILPCGLGTIGVGQLPAGVYVLTIDHEAGYRVARFSKQ